MTRFAALIALFLSMLSPTQGTAGDITVFAAASLRGALEEIAARYDGTVRLSFGGSGTIARQVAAGAPADVIVLANTAWMDWLQGQGALGTTRPIIAAENALVLIGQAPGAPLTDVQAIPQRLGDGRLAMGQRDAVPAGIYARQWLEAAGLWETLRTRLAETDNVRAALALVARGEVPMGVVYASDAQAEARVAVLWSVPAPLHDPIVYPAAALTPQGAAFRDHLTSDQSQQIFAAHGFAPEAK